MLMEEQVKDSRRREKKGGITPQGGWSIREGCMEEAELAPSPRPGLLTPVTWFLPQCSIKFSKCWLNG